jgi:hypothetical protein
VQSDIVATSGAYTYGFARFSADLPRTLFAHPPPHAAALIAYLTRDTTEGDFTLAVSAFSSTHRGRVLVARAQLAPSRGRADPTRGRRDVRQDRAWGMVRHLYISAVCRSPLLTVDCICTQDEWLGAEIRARAAYACTSQVGFTTLAMTQTHDL